MVGARRALRSGERHVNTVSRGWRPSGQTDHRQTAGRPCWSSVSHL